MVSAITSVLNKVSDCGSAVKNNWGKLAISVSLVALAALCAWGFWQTMESDADKAEEARDNGEPETHTSPLIPVSVISGSASLVAGGACAIWFAKQVNKDMATKAKDHQIATA